MNRIIFSDNGTLIDLSNSLASYYSAAKPFEVVGAEDYLYIGSRFPFNSKYIKLDTPSTTPVEISIQYWQEDWIDAVEVIDETEGLTKSGLIRFTPNKRFNWEMESTNYEGEIIPDLSSLVIYDLYWVKVSFSGNVDSGTAIKWVGDLFSNDNDLGSEFPDLNRSNVLTSFKSGKTDWEEQHIAAARLLVDDLKDKGYIRGSEQILDTASVKGAAVQKCAEIIYRSFGTDYTDKADACHQEYNRRLERRFVTLDKNNNAIEDPFERSAPTGWLSR